MSGPYDHLSGSEMNDGIGATVGGPTELEYLLGQLVYEDMARASNNPWPTPHCMIRRPARLAELLDIMPTERDASGLPVLPTPEVIALRLRSFLAGEPSGSKCEHGIAEGDWCEPCNKEYKRAAREHGYAP